MKKETIFIGILLIAAILVLVLVLALRPNSQGYYMAEGSMADNTLTIRPNAQGYYSAWTNVGCGSGSLEWQCVDEDPANISDNLQTTSMNVYESFALGNTGLTNAIINKVTVYFYAQRQNNKRYQFQPLLRINGSDYLGSVKSLTSSYAYYSEVYANNPATGRVWTISEVDALEAGMKSYSTNYGGRIVQIYAVVDYSRPDSCFDTDGGQMLKVLGNVSGYLNQNYYIYSDYCTSNTTIIEYYCSGSYSNILNSSCLSNSTSFCWSGRCM